MTDLRARLSARARAAFGEEEREGLMLAVRVRIACLAVVFAWQVIDNPFGGLAYAYELASIAAFILLGLAQYLCARRRRCPPWAVYLFVVIDCALLAVVFTLPNPFVDHDIPPSVAMRGSRIVWYFLFLTQAAFSLRPRLVLWCGLCIALARTGSLLWVVSQPGVFTDVDLAGHDIDTIIMVYFDPYFVPLSQWIGEAIASLLVAAGLAVVVARTRRFVESRSAAERGRANLARYFSPNVVDDLSSSEDLVRGARDQPVAVLFADIIGFTRLCEAEPAEGVVRLLRDYHGRLAEAVFENHGTLDKYIGDGLMATFGTPRTGPGDATNGLRCALDMVASIEGWNAERAAAGLTPVRVGVGLHYGRVIIGDIGDERRLEFAVIGDSVNIASRVEHMTRRLGTALTISEDVVTAVRREADGGEALLDRFVDAGVQQIRGREGPIRLWMLPGGASP